MLTISGFDLNPTPVFSITPEYYYYGNEILGGIFVMNIQGTYYADDSTDYNNTVESFLNKNGECVLVSTDHECGTAPLENCIGNVQSVEISPAGSVLDFTYNMVIHISKGATKNILIERSNNLPEDLNASELDNIIINSYSENADISYDNSNMFVVANSIEKFASAFGKVNISVNIGLVNSDICDDKDTDYKKIIRDFLIKRVNSIVNKLKINNPNNKLSLNIPTTATLRGSNGGLSISELNGSATFELFICPFDTNNKAIITVSTTSETNQITRQNKVSLRGTIQGLADSDIFFERSGGTLSNAQSALNSLKTVKPETINSVLDGSCGVATPLDVDTCFGLVKSSTTEETNNGRIQFELVYEDIEKCIKQGYRIITEYEEKPPIKKYVEHLIPGRTNTLVYYSDSLSAKRYKLTVKTRIKSCGDDISIIKNVVDVEFQKQKTEFNLGTTSNLITLSSIKDEGKYSYAKTEEYIECV